MKWRKKRQQSKRSEEMALAVVEEWEEDDDFTFATVSTRPPKTVIFDEDDSICATEYSAVTGVTGCSSIVKRKKAKKYPQAAIFDEDDTLTYTTGYSDATGFNSLKDDDLSRRNTNLVWCAKEEPLEVTLGDGDGHFVDGDDSLVWEGEYLNDGDRLCAGCECAVPVKKVKTEVTGSYQDLASTLYQVSTAWMLQDDELDKMTGSIKDARLSPSRKQRSPWVKLFEEDLKVGNKRVNIYV